MLVCKLTFCQEDRACIFWYFPYISLEIDTGLCGIFLPMKPFSHSLYKVSYRALKFEVTI